MLPEVLSEKRILFSSLNWGSGHVARSIPLLQDLIAQKNDLFVCCTKEQQAVFLQYDIEANYLVRDGFHFRFKGDGNFNREMVRNGLRFSRWIKHEKRQTEQFVQKHQIDLVLSDHCYGFRSDKVHSIFITHQVQLPPKSGWLAQRIHKRWMSKFNEIWIMDEANNRLAGTLSESVSNATYIGWYSRFRNSEITTIPGKVVGIISGPEPYAEQLFHWVLENYSHEDLLLISPKNYGKLSESIPVINDWKEADLEIASAETIISRNGYSTLMDLQILKKKAILIPTPGQLEQEYLATLK